MVLDTRTQSTAFAPRVDSTVLQDVAGPTNLASALAGRFAGAEVLNSSALGGTSAMFVRGPHTIAGTTQPLVVVNGILVGNDNVTNLTQSSGGGGFDYGSAINDLNLDDIASVELLRGPVAALRYGGRAANGVLVVTTKNGRGLMASSSPQTSSSAIRPCCVCPATRTRTVRVSVVASRSSTARAAASTTRRTRAGDRSWPASWYRRRASPRPARADVRAFLANPSNVSGYYLTGKTLTTNVALQGGERDGSVPHRRQQSHRRRRHAAEHLTTRSVMLTAGMQPTARFAVTGDLQLYTDRGEDRPGSGFDESNNVSVFSHMPRQVDVVAYQTRLRDVALKPLSWNYAGHNGPYFGVLENDNHDDRYALDGWRKSASYAHARTR